MEDTSLISCLCWVSKGFARQVPQQYVMKNEEFEELKNDPVIKQKRKEMDIEDFDMDKYDEEPDLPAFSSEVHDNIDKNDDNYPDCFEDASDEDKEDYNIKDTDAIIVAGRIERHEFSGLEVYIYEEQSCNLYVHHDITLSAFPLAIEWLSIVPGSVEAQSYKKGNYAILGSFIPDIEIWDLDTLDVIEPSLVLGGEEVSKKKQPKKFNNQPKLKAGSHEDAVISLNLHKTRREILASGSADTKVKLWDLVKETCAVTYDHHKNKVQTVRWHNNQESRLLTAGFDRRINYFDAKDEKNRLTISMSSDIESCIWDPIQENIFYYTTDDGKFVGYDINNTKKPLFEIKCHSKAATSVSASYFAKGLVSTCSQDGNVKLWDTMTIKNNEPLLLIEKNMKAVNTYDLTNMKGKLNCGGFYQDNPWLAGFGNNKGELVIWDVSENENISSYFSSRLINV